MIDPFDLRGPEFLLFYLLLGVTVNLALRCLTAQREKERPAALTICTDPYQLAALRGGAGEALRVVLFSLIDRGLLKAVATKVAAEPEAKGVVTERLEQDVVAFFSQPRQAAELADGSLAEAGKELCRELASEGLLADQATFERRRIPALASLLLLVGVSGTKVLVALSRGRHNLVFLMVLTVIFTLWVLITWRRERTGAGDHVLRQARARYSPLKVRAASIRPGGMGNEAVLAAALFGLGVLPADYFPYVAGLFPSGATSGGDYSGGCGDGGSSGGCGGGGGCGGCGGS